MSKAFASLSDVLRHYGLTSPEALADCGCGGSGAPAPANMDMLFPRYCSAKWITVRADTDTLSPSFNLENEIDALLAAPPETKTKLALLSDLSALKDNFFTIKTLEFAAYDVDSGMAGNWLFNHFNPQLLVNDEPLIEGLGALPNGKPDQSGLGLTLPHCLSFDLPFKPLRSIVVRGELRRKDNMGELRHLPLAVKANFKYRT